MKHALFALLFLSASIANGADFTVHEGPNIFVGTGGEKTVQDGVDFWLNEGSPPRRYQLLGYLTADVNSAGLNGMISMKRLPGKIAKQTKEFRGDAVIVLDESTQTWQGGATATTTNYGNPYQTTTQINQKTFARTKIRYAVVKYLGDTQPAAPVPERAADAQ